MPPKSAKGKKGVKTIDWAADEHFDSNRAMVYIEHTDECPIFQIKALEFYNTLVEKFPEKIFLLIRNREPARVGAFEIKFSQNARTSQHLLWSGINYGPPRKRKFPKDFDNLVVEVEKLLKKIYVVIKRREEEEEAPVDFLDGDEEFMDALEDE